MSAVDRTRRRAPGLRRDRRGAVAVEYAMILPAFLTLAIGAFEFGLILFDHHRLNEATRRGVRQGVIEDPIGDLSNLQTTDVVCAGSASVSCTGGSVQSQAAFDAVVAAMRAIAPQIEAGNVTVTYSDSGLTGDAATPGVATPVVTVSLSGMSHRYFFLNDVAGFDLAYEFPPFTTSALGPSIPLP